jgi:hypothetical protein
MQTWVAARVKRNRCPAVAHAASAPASASASGDSHAGFVSDHEVTVPACTSSCPADRRRAARLLPLWPLWLHRPRQQPRLARRPQPRRRAPAAADADGAGLHHDCVGRAAHARAERGARGARCGGMLCCAASAAAAMAFAALGAGFAEPALASALASRVLLEQSVLLWTECHVSRASPCTRFHGLCRSSSWTTVVRA